MPSTTIFDYLRQHMKTKWLIGDNSENMYLNLLNKFLKDEAAFNHFRQNLLYKSIIGEPQIIQAIKFHDDFMKDDDFKHHMFKSLDSVGSPTIISKTGYSTNTLRYINSLQILKNNFVSIDDCTILEYGAGYGGLLNAMRLYYGNGFKYYMKDVCNINVEFVRKYSNAIGGMSNHIINDEIDYHFNEPKINLFIAEYSLTELNEDGLMEDTKKYLMPSEHIFIRCNILNEALKAKWIALLEEKFVLTRLNEPLNLVKANEVIIGHQK